MSRGGHALGGVQGTVYLIHFDEPYGHAKHYLGWGTGDAAARIAKHRTGNGANLMAVIRRAGIGWQLVRTWDGSRHLERRLKNGGGSARYCPACNPSGWKKRGDWNG